MAEKEYIERGSALFNLETGWFPQSMEYTEAVEIARNLIKSLPAAAVVEVRHGRWETVIGTRNSPKWGNNHVACSECRRSGYTRFAYCPNCGAKMDGVTDTNVGSKMDGKGE